MTAIFLPLALIALLGALLRHFVPGMEDRRQAMNQMVLYVFLPALVFHTVMEARLDRLFIEIPIVAATCVLAAWSRHLSSSIFCRFQVPPRAPCCLAVPSET